MERKYTSFDSSNFTVSDLKKKNGKQYISLDLSTDFQSPVFTTLEVIDFNEVALNSAFFKVDKKDKKASSFFKYMEQFDDYIQNVICTALYEGNTPDELEDKLKSSFTSKGNMKIFLSRSKTNKKLTLKVVDRDNKNIDDISVISVDSKLVGILRCRKIIITNEEIYPQWEFIKVSLKPKKIIKEHCIIYESDSESDSEDEYYGHN